MTTEVEDLKLTVARCITVMRQAEMLMDNRPPTDPIDITAPTQELAAAITEMETAISKHVPAGTVPPWEVVTSTSK